MYQYIFFDRETMEFQHIESASIDELNSEAYAVWMDVVNGYKDLGQFNSISFGSFQEFALSDRHYIDCLDIGGLEGIRVTL